MSVSMHAGRDNLSFYVCVLIEQPPISYQTCLFAKDVNASQTKTELKNPEFSFMQLLPTAQKQ